MFYWGPHYFSVCGLIHFDSIILDILRKLAGHSVTRLAGSESSTLDFTAGPHSAAKTIKNSQSVTWLDNKTGCEKGVKAVHRLSYINWFSWVFSFGCLAACLRCFWSERLAMRWWTIYTTVQYCPMMLDPDFILNISHLSYKLTLTVLKHEGHSQFRHRHEWTLNVVLLHLPFVDPTISHGP